MKYFKNVNNELHAFEDDISDELLDKYVAERGLTAITDAEFIAMTTPTAEQLEEQAKQAQIAEAKAYLAGTDWIIAKIAETTALGEPIADMLTKYSSELSMRADKRAIINSLESV